MILIIDIGNTQIVFTGFDIASNDEEEQYQNLFNFRIDSNLNYNDDDYKNLIISKVKSKSFNIEAENISKIAIVSVVTELTEKLSRICKSIFAVEPKIVEHKDFNPLESEYYNLNELGLDRLSNAYAVYKKYKESIIVIDFGSAITFEIIDSKGIFVGGMILPGVKLNSEVLNSKTSLLPKIDLNNFPDKIIGKSTEECISSGIMYGTLELCKGLINQIENELGEKNNMKIVLTGGYSHIFKDKLGREAILEKDLVSLGVLYLMLDK